MHLLCQDPGRYCSRVTSWRMGAGRAVAGGVITAEDIRLSSPHYGIIVNTIIILSPPPPLHHHTSPVSGSRSRPCVIFLLKLMQKAGLRLDSTLYNELIHHHSVLYICEIDIKSFKYWICLFPLTKENVPLTGTGIVGHCTVSVRTIRETWALSQSRTIQCSVFTIHTAHPLTRSLSHCYCPGVVQNLHETKYFTHLYLWQ